MIHEAGGSGSDADDESEKESEHRDSVCEETRQACERGQAMSRALKTKQNKKARLSEEEEKCKKTADKPVRNEVSVADWAWDVEKERRLKEIATRGAVRLFNAVNKQQKETEAKLRESNTEAKRARVVKSVNQHSFVDILRESCSVKSSISGKKRHVYREKGAEQPAWTVLRDDFMMAAKMRDWDKDNSNSSNEETP